MPPRYLSLSSSSANPFSLRLCAPRSSRRFSDCWLRVVQLVAPHGDGDLLGVIPSASIVAQEAVCNLVVAGVASALHIDGAAFKANHPGGAIGGRQ